MKNLAINNGEPILKQKFKEKWPIISEEDIKSVEELMKKGEISYYGLEGKLKEFEEEICKYFNVKYALAVNSGTSSLHSGQVMKFYVPLILFLPQSPQFFNVTQNQFYVIVKMILEIYVQRI